MATAAALRKAANDFFNKQEYGPAAEEYRAACFWIGTIVKSKLVKVQEAELESAKKEAVLILGNLSAVMLKLNQPYMAIVAGTECITMDTDGSYFKVRCNCMEVFSFVALIPSLCVCFHCVVGFTIVLYTFVASSQGYFRRAEALKMLGLRVVTAGKDAAQHFFYAMQDYSECYKRMRNAPEEAGMRAARYYDALELAACYCE